LLLCCAVERDRRAGRVVRARDLRVLSELPEEVGGNNRNAPWSRLNALIESHYRRRTAANGARCHSTERLISACYRKWYPLIDAHHGL
jgi:hypothetical protein